MFNQHGVEGVGAGKKIRKRKDGIEGRSENHVKSEEPERDLIGRLNWIASEMRAWDC